MSLGWVDKDMAAAYTHLLHSKADPRTNEWALVKPLWIPASVTFCYLCFCINARFITYKMQTYQLRPLIVFYNAAMLLLSCYMTYEFVLTAYLAGYSLTCQSVDFSSDPLAIRMARICWIYYFSKYIELTETGLFALRKKYNQISVLHVYHHTSMIWIWWMTLKYSAGGQAYIFGAINSFVHAIMYSYYGLSAFGPRMQKYLWWKKYITMLQLSQFVILFFFCIRSVAISCSFAKWLCQMMIGYAVTLLILFLNFYRKTYLVKNTSLKKKFQTSATIISRKKRH